MYNEKVNFDSADVPATTTAEAAAADSAKAQPSAKQTEQMDGGEKVHPLPQKTAQSKGTEIITSESGDQTVKTPAGETHDMTPEMLALCGFLTDIRLGLDSREVFEGMKLIRRLIDQGRESDLVEMGFLDPTQCDFLLISPFFISFPLFVFNSFSTN